MRTAALTLLSLVAFGYAMHAQKFSLLPQLGFENTKTTVRYNNSSPYAPEGVVFTPQVSLQFIYRSKPGHSLYLGAANSRSIVDYKFSDPENGMTSYTSNTGKMQVRLEGGYQFASKPIYFKKQSNTASTKKVTTNTTTHSTAEKKKCGSYYYRSYCTKNKPTEQGPAEAEKTMVKSANKGGWVKLLPSVGMGFIPGVQSDIVTSAQNGLTEYEYRAGNWQTALQAGMGFEFGKNETRQFTLGINYIKGLGNLNTQHVSTVNGTKTINTQLQSDVSGWNLRMGIPFTLGGKKPVAKTQTKTQKAQKTKTGCGQYRIMYRCTRTI